MLSREIPTIQKFCTFWIADLYLGLSVMHVQELIGHQKMTLVPAGPRGVAGLVNLRGQIITTLDLRVLLELPSPRPQTSMNAVLQVDGEVISFLVDRVGDVIDLDDADREEVPPTLSGPARNVLSCAYKLPDQLLLILDLQKCLKQITTASRHQGVFSQ